MAKKRVAMKAKRLSDGEVPPASERKKAAKKPGRKGY